MLEMFLFGIIIHIKENYLCFIAILVTIQLRANNK